MKYIELKTTNYLNIMEQYHVGPLVGKVVDSFQYSQSDLDSFFNPQKYERLEDKSFQEFWEIMSEAQQQNQKVFVFGDYDCDGLCATAIMIKALKKQQIDCGYYIPNRFSEGYGLNLARVKQAREKGYDILVTVDNGVSAHESLVWAKENGMKVIVTDHHLIEKEVECDLLVHPSLLPEPYQYLCGAGVAYLIADYNNLTDDVMTVLAMVATIGDVMELKGFNIQLINEGLRLLNNHKCKTIEALGSGFTFPVDEQDISYKIVPKLNAVGRMSDIANPNNVVRFLLCEDDREINQFVKQINDVNQARKDLSNKQYQKVLSYVDDSKGFLLVKVEGLHEGLIGLMASKLTDATNKPCIIFTNSQGLLKGSGRSVPGFDIMELVSGFSDGVVAIGGHKQALGITIEANKYDLLVEYIENNYIAPLEEVSKPYLKVTLDDLSRSNLEELFSYKPFGQGRKLPLMCLSVPSYADYRHLKNNNQLKWTIRNKNQYISLLSFSDNDGYEAYLNKEVKGIGNIRKNVFNGKVNYDIICEAILTNEG